MHAYLPDAYIPVRGTITGEGNNGEAKWVDERAKKSLIDPSFQVVNRFFVLLFKSATDKTLDMKCNGPTAKIRNYNVMMNRVLIFDQPVNIDE